MSSISLNDVFNKNELLGEVRRKSAYRCVGQTSSLILLARTSSWRLSLSASLEESDLFTRLTPLLHGLLPFVFCSDACLTPPPNAYDTHKNNKEE